MQVRLLSGVRIGTWRSLVALAAGAARSSVRIRPTRLWRSQSTDGAVRGRKLLGKHPSGVRSSPARRTWWSGPHQRHDLERPFESDVCYEVGSGTRSRAQARHRLSGRPPCPGSSAGEHCVDNAEGGGSTPSRGTHGAFGYGWAAGLSPRRSGFESRTRCSFRCRVIGSPAAC